VSPAPFADRRAAGRALGRALADRRLAPPVLVLALPRGGVPVAAEVARALRAPLELLLVRKIGAPWQPELAVAAVVEGDPPEVVVDETVRGATAVQRDWIDRQAEAELQEIARRRRLYRAGRELGPLGGATVVLVDDGIATGTTVRAALAALRRRGAARIVLAVPVAPRDTLATLRGDVDELVCLAQPEPFDAVGCHYVDFRQVGDDEVMSSLALAAGPGSEQENGDGRSTAG
jgi:putative phosphoribosyl transferase